MKRKREEVERREIRAKLFRLIDQGDTKEAIELIPAYREHYEYLSGARWPLIHYAVIKGEYDIVDYLLVRGENIELKHPQDGITPLLAAARNNQEECCDVLINRGANIEARDRHERTPLILASIRGHERVCKLLLRRKADVNARDENGDTSLILATHYERDNACKLLINKGADINAHSNAGWTALDCAVRNHHLSLMKHLLSAGVQIDDKAIEIAKMRINKDMISLLENQLVTEKLSGMISRGLTDGLEFSDFLVKGICDARLFLIVAKFAYQ